MASLSSPSNNVLGLISGLNPYDSNIGIQIPQSFTDYMNNVLGLQNTALAQQGQEYQAGLSAEQQAALAQQGLEQQQQNQSQQGQKFQEDQTTNFANPQAAQAQAAAIAAQQSQTQLAQQQQAQANQAQTFGENLASEQANPFYQLQLGQVNNAVNRGIAGGSSGTGGGSAADVLAILRGQTSPAASNVPMVYNPATGSWRAANGSDYGVTSMP